MGIHRSDGGYSAHVEGFLVINGQKIRLAKSNGVTLVLADRCSIAPNTEAELQIHVDGHKDSQRVLLEDGATEDRSVLRYRLLAPF